MKIYIAIILFIFVLSCDFVLAQTSSSIPSIETVIEISITRVDYPWELTIKPDGSGILISGSDSEALMPKGTFSFSDVYNRVLPHLNGQHLDTKTISVHFYIKGADHHEQVVSFFLDDKRIVRPLFILARDTIAPTVWNGGLFKEEMLEHSPVPENSK